MCLNQVDHVFKPPFSFLYYKFQEIGGMSCV